MARADAVAAGETPHRHVGELVSVEKGEAMIRSRLAGIVRPDEPRGHVDLGKGRGAFPWIGARIAAEKHPTEIASGGDGGEAIADAGRPRPPVGELVLEPPGRADQNGEPGSTAPFHEGGENRGLLVGHHDDEIRRGRRGGGPFQGEGPDPGDGREGAGSDEMIATGFADLVLEVRGVGRPALRRDGHPVEKDGSRRIGHVEGHHVGGGETRGVEGVGPRRHLEAQPIVPGHEVGAVEQLDPLEKESIEDHATREKELGIEATGAVPGRGDGDEPRDLSAGEPLPEKLAPRPRRRSGDAGDDRD